MGYTTLAVISGTIDQFKYQEILSDHLLPNANAFYGNDWRFEQDNARPHTALTTRAWLEEHVPEILVSPPNCADWWPIENLWDILKDSVEKCDAKTFPEFRDLVVQKWSELDPSLPSRMIDSIPRRLKYCRDHRGAQVDLKLI